MIRAACLALVFLMSLQAEPTTSAAPLKLAIAGLVHGHVSGFFNRSLPRKEIQLVGVAEPNATVRAKYADKYHFDSKLMFASVEEMLDRTKPEAVAIFSNTFDHLKIVQACASRGIPVMMEKPLAVSMEHARGIADAAKRGNIPVIVNYETTWYRSNHAAYALAREGKLGDLRKIVVHDGHRGPKEIGTQPEFFDWLTDPVRNGAGALMDFGCYGADLITWLLDGQRPLTVTAVTQQIKPEIYSKVDDEATILVTYPKTQGIIQASWNWPFDRKDMEVYGRTGTVFTVRGNDIRVRLEGQDETSQAAPALASPEDDPISYLVAVARRQIKPTGLSSLEINLIATEILDAANRSAKTGRTVVLGK